MKIYVSFRRPRTVKEFLIMFYQLNSASFVDGSGRAVQTYRDKNCKVIQCGLGRLRSPQDIYDCVRTYFPNVRLDTVFSTLLKLKTKDGRFIYPSYCWDIRRPVTSWGTYKNHDMPQYNGAYGWKTILNALGINNKIEYHKYIGV